MPGREALSQILVKHLWELKYEDLPSTVINQAKRCIIDYLGVALAGSTQESAKKVRLFLSKFNDNAGITAIGYNLKTDVFKAALANGITSHILELDDGHRQGTAHSGAAIISALLPLAEHENLSGKQVITGVVAGYEASIRIGSAIQPSHRNCGFHATATCGTFGAAIAASKALNLSQGEMSHALGIAGTSASGLQQYLIDGSEIKQYHPGKAAFCGLLSAYLAQSGLTAPIDILEGKLGFFNAATKKFNPAAITNDLKNTYSILDVYFKPYAACRHCHSPIEATINIRNTKKPEAAKIEKIKVLTYKSAVDGHDNPAPQNEVAAKMSVPFSVAVALKFGRAGVKEFTPVSICDRDILNLSKRVFVQEEPELSHLYPKKQPAIIEILLKDGSKFIERIDFPKGAPENPLTDKEIINKYEELASCRCPKEDVMNIVEIIHDMESKMDILFNLLK